MPLLALFVLLPVIEIALFILAGAEFGFWPTLGLVGLTTLTGVLVLRRQGSVTLRHLQEAQRGLSDPTTPMAHGALLYLAGLLLILPGFLTDAFGLLLLLPPVRRLILTRLSAGIRVHTSTGFRSRETHEDVIDGEATEIFPEARPLPRSHPSGWTNPPEDSR